MPTVAAGELGDSVAAALRTGGAGDSAAEVVAEEPVTADLRGHDSHGVAHLPCHLAGDSPDGRVCVAFNVGAIRGLIDGLPPRPASCKGGTVP